jgi:uncharacterized membrane protein YuzA (DUF378 family)
MKVSNNVKYALIGVGALVVLMAIIKYRKEKNEPIINAEMDDLLKRIDEAKK